MTNRDFEIIYKRLCHDVANRQLNAAFNHMKELANECQNPYAQSQCEEIEETYLNLLKYAVDRYDDPERDNIFNKIQIQLLELADDLRNSHFTKNSNNIVYQYKRSTDTNVAASRSDGSFLRNYFMELFLSDKYSAVQTEQCIETISAPDIRENYKCTLVSAVMLGLIRTFDEAKLHLLLDFFNLPSKAIRQRALVALVFAASIYSQRIPIYKKLHTRIAIWLQDEGITQNLQNTILQILLTKETEKIAKKMKEAIPEILKTEISKDKSFMDLLSSEGDMSAPHPQWQSLLENAGFSEKAIEISKLQMEGGDIFHGTFSQMKNYPFFDAIENWFLPFYEAEIASRHNTSSNDLTNEAEAINGSVFLCNSDKYSMLFALDQLPKNYINMMRETFRIEKEQTDELKSEEKYKESFSEEKLQTRLYVQDLFRFYKLYNYKNDFSNPFTSIKDLDKNILISENPQKRKFLQSIADYYINKGYFDEAVEILHEVGKCASSVDVLRKTAYCHQMRGNYREASKYYEKANLTEPGSLWTLQRLAYCAKQCEEFEESIAYYKECASLAPNDLQIQASIGYCQMHLHQHADALKNFFKVHYLHPEDYKICKAIGWCSFLNNKLEQAETYYGKCPESALNRYDFMNIAHIMLCRNKTEEATVNYKKAFQLLQSDKKEFTKLFQEDATNLVNNGVKAEDISLMLDYILYAVER